MSKSTDKYGTVTLRVSTTITADPTPSKRLLRQRAKIESASRKLFNRAYDALSDKEKSDLHYKVAIMREHQRAKKEGHKN